jgi:ABC-type xylose transport system substrate-binding protein
MKSLLAFIGLFIFSLPFAFSQAAPMKIGLVLSTLQEERYQKDQKYFNEEAKKLGFEAIVVSADNNPQTQSAKVENLLSQGVKALVIQPVNSEAAANLVKMAHEDKVPVVAYDRGFLRHHGFLQGRCFAGRSRGQGHP